MLHKKSKSTVKLMVDGELQSCFCSPASRDPTRTIQYSSPVSSSYPPNLLSLWLYSTVQLAKKHKNNYTWSWTNIGWSVLVRGKTKMHYFKFPMLLLSLWLITLLSLTKTESAPTYSAHICSNSTFFIANGTTKPTSTSSSLLLPQTPQTTTTMDSITPQLGTTQLTTWSLVSPFVVATSTPPSVKTALPLQAKTYCGDAL